VKCAAGKTSNRATVAQRVQKHRKALRAAGLRPIQIWVPGVRSRSFATQAHKQSLAVAKSRHGGEDQAFIDAIAEFETP
jgi:Protein  of unknown function (DUF3018)